MFLPVFQFGLAAFLTGFPKFLGWVEPYVQPALFGHQKNAKETKQKSSDIVLHKYHTICALLATF